MEVQHRYTYQSRVRVENAFQAYTISNMHRDHIIVCWKAERRVPTDADPMPRHESLLYVEPKWFRLDFRLEK